MGQTESTIQNKCRHTLDSQEPTKEKYLRLKFLSLGLARPFGVYQVSPRQLLLANQVDLGPNSGKLLLLASLLSS